MDRVGRDCSADDASVDDASRCEISVGSDGDSGDVCSSHVDPQPFHSESWCTGEDSNLRSPLGAADLQSAAINHSATCARPAKRNRPPESPNLLSKTTCPAPGPSGEMPQTPRAAIVARIQSSKLLLGSVLLESSASCLACFCRYASRRAQGLKSGAGEGI